MDEFILQPASHLGDAPGGLRFARNMLRNLAQMHGLREDQADDDPDPVRNPFQMRFGMNGTQLRKHGCTILDYCSCDWPFGFGVTTPRLCQFHEQFAKC